MTITHTKINELAALDIDHPHFSARLVLQGAQLLSFATKDATSRNEAQNEDQQEDNWLWLSELAEYKKGVSVRGGVPICWPVFGIFDCNPESVKTSFEADAQRMAKHGSARKQVFELVAQEVTETTVNLQLRYMEADYGLQLDARFVFSRDGIDITLTTTNASEKALTFSQALHTYFPTPDISHTHVTGLDGMTYTDTLQNWQEMTQNGDIEFSQEVDRIYHGSPAMEIKTPSHVYSITTTGSSSTVVWNPWIETSQNVSQFADDAYKQMLCVEVANAHKDVVSLGAGKQHLLQMFISRTKHI